MINISLFRKFPLLAILITVNYNTAEAQLTEGRKGDEYLDIGIIIELLEKKNETRIFINHEWLDSKEYPASLVNMPLEKALQKILDANQLTALYYDHLIVIVPSEKSRRESVIIKDNIIDIGDPAEYGRYRTATISGRVFDGSNNEPLLGAVIYDVETSTGASTGPDGAFSLTLPAGKHVLKVSFVGFEELTRQVNLFGDGSLNFEIFEETHRIDEVTIRARRAEENVARAQMSMITLDSRAIKELPGSFGEQDILRSISMMPGIQTVGEFGTGFHVRGGSADQNLILIEDVPVFNSSHLFGLTSVVNPDMVTSVSLIKAGIPARYGERASAVMDIRLRNQNPEKTSVSGGIGLINSRLNLETPVVRDKISLSLGGRTSYSDWLLGEIPDTDLMNSSATFHDLGGTLHLSPSQKNNISVFGYHSYDRFMLAGTTDYRYTNTLGSIRWNSIPGEKIHFSLSAGFSLYDYLVAEEEDANPNEAYDLGSSIDYRSLKWHFNYYPTDNNVLEFGVNAVRYEINPGAISPLGTDSYIEPFRLDNEKGVELAGFISNRITFGPRLEAEAGLRYSRFYLLGPSRQFNYLPGEQIIRENITDTVLFSNNEIAAGYGGLEPRLSIRYSLGGSSSLKLSYNRINQYINLLSNTSVIAPSDIWKLSDNYLKPLRADQYAAGYFRNFLNNTIETSVELYYKNLCNIPEYKTGAQLMMNETLETDLVNAHGYSYGLELYANKISGRITGWASYTYSATRIRTDEPLMADRINNNSYFPSNHDRPHNLVLNTNYHISRRWRFNATFTWNSGRPVTLPELSYEFGEQQLIHYSDRNRYRMPDYHRLDLALNFGENLRRDRRGKGSWTLSIINIYGRKNAYSVYYQKDIPSEENNFRNYSLNKMYIIGRPFPTLTYNFSF